MGNTRSKNTVSINNNKTKRCNTIMSGLDAAGKTTMIYQLLKGQQVKYSTYFWNCERMDYKNLVIDCWDAGGQEKIRPLWRYYYETANALIWVVDSNDVERMEYDPLCDNSNYSSHYELHRMLNECLMRDVIVLVLINKRDLPNTVSIEKVQHKIGMFQYNKSDAMFLKTILTDLPHAVIDIIAEYTPHRETGPCWSRRISVDHISEAVPLRHAMPFKIYACICSYLPPWKVTNGTQTKCKVYGVSALNANDLLEPFEWLNNAIKETGSTSKQCVIM